MDIQSTPIHKHIPDVTQQFSDNIHSPLYKSPKTYNTFTTQSNPKVKRNLSDSFNETPKSVNKHLNYFVIEDDKDSSLVLKLRLLKSQPYVHLKRSTEITRRLAEPPPQYIRKSRRISFADERLTSAKISESARKVLGTISPESDSIKRIKSPQKHSRSEKVASNRYDVCSTKSPRNNKNTCASGRIRPRRCSVIQRSYKEVCTEGDVDGSDGSFPSPAKRTRSGRSIKRPIRYEGLSDDDIIDGVEELDISDRDCMISSPLKRSCVDVCDVEDEELELKLKLQESQNHPQNTISHKPPHPPIKKTHNHPSPPTKITLQSLIPAPLKKPTFTPATNKTHPKTHSSITTIKAHTPHTPSPPHKTSKFHSTPTSKIKLTQTPSVQSRATAVKPPATPLNIARRALHVAHVPDALPCRETEAEDIYGFVAGKLIDGCGGCMYISGVPGTGKTATVTFVIRQLQHNAMNDKLPIFDYVSVNGMRLTEPRQSYVEIFKQLTGKIIPWEQAQNQLISKFTKKGQKGTKPIVLLIDELDILCTKRQDVVYNLLDWPSKAFCQLIVVTIANTMDLPERLLMGRVTSRLGLTRLTFQAYNHKQLQEIVTKRLHDTKTFNPDAIQLVARKVASVSGDARRALDICRRAAEMAEADDKNNLISMTHVNAALDCMMTQPKIRAIKSSSRLQKLLLQSIVAEIERTGVEETTFSAVFKIFSTLAAIDGFAMVSVTMAMTAVAKLGACRLLLLDPKISGLYHRIMLNVSVDDVYYALKSD